MPSDFWSIDDILLSEEAVNGRFTSDSVGLGHLDPLRAASGARDLPRGSVLSLPLWLLVPLCKSDCVEVILPESYKTGMQNVLRKGAEGGRFRDKSVNYFEVGLLLSWLLNDTELASALFVGILQRISFIIDQSAHSHRNEDIESEFLHRLTNFEQRMYLLGVNGNMQYDLWRHGILSQIKMRIEI